MRLGLICGDGLPVSGVLTVFRSIFDLGRREGLLDAVVPTDLGFSWRPDRESYFPGGSQSLQAPAWMQLPAIRVTDNAEVTRLRDMIIRIEHNRPLAELGNTARKEQLSLSSRLGNLFYEYYLNWLIDASIDWVIAANMTLPDASPVTWALYAAAQAYYSARGKGGIVFWDHDLFASCGALADDGSRVYPVHPSELMFVPRSNGVTHWVVVSEELAAETKSYPTSLTPQVVPNILPRITTDKLASRHIEFANQFKLHPGRPIILNPVRLTRVKGVHLAVQLLAGMKHKATLNGSKIPYLLIFGMRDEDPSYAQEVAELVGHLGLYDDVRFLDGVPISSYHSACDGWRLDQVDLCQLAQASRGGVAFTPGVSDVESVGLGPGLAGAASVPCAVAQYNTLEKIYSAGMYLLRFPSYPEAAFTAGQEFALVLHRFMSGDRDLMRLLNMNQNIISERFPEQGWRALLVHLAGQLDNAGPIAPRSAAVRIAFQASQSLVGRPIKGCPR